MAKVTFEFDSFEDAEELATFQQALEQNGAMGDIYNLVRTELKHSDEDHSDDIEMLLERIKEISSSYI